MSALHSIKKNMRHLTPIESRMVDRRIIAGEYQSPLSEVSHAVARERARELLARESKSPPAAASPSKQ